VTDPASDIPLRLYGTTTEQPALAWSWVEAQLRDAGPDPAELAAYDAKYEWQYDVAEYGPFTHVAPTVVMARRAGGRAGRDGFQQVGRWHFR
jgi:hypothetical protein